MIETFFHSVRVIFSDEARETIENCVKDAANLFEVGGALLGHKRGRRFYIVAVTVPQKNAESSLVSFVLDGEYHTKKAQELAVKFKCPPRFLGIWHSHICDGPNFSEQDRQSNLQLAKFLGGALSILSARAPEDMTYRLSAFFITEKGDEIPCCVIHDDKAAIPRRFTERTGYER